MSKTEKTEFIFNCVVVVLSIALAVFIVGYEHYAMERYTESLEQENELGGGIATSLLFIFFYLPVSACSCVLALILFGVTWRMYRVCGKRKVDFAADKACRQDQKQMLDCADCVQGDCDGVCVVSRLSRV